jgi:hypothetical protein
MTPPGTGHEFTWAPPCINAGFKTPTIIAEDAGSNVVSLQQTKKVASARYPGPCVYDTDQRVSKATTILTPEEQVCPSAMKVRHGQDGQGLGQQSSSISRYRAPSSTGGMNVTDLSGRSHVDRRPQTPLIAKAFQNNVHAHSPADPRPRLDAGNHGWQPPEARNTQSSSVAEGRPPCESIEALPASEASSFISNLSAIIPAPLQVDKVSTSHRLNNGTLFQSTASSSANYDGMQFAYTQDGTVGGPSNGPSAGTTGSDESPNAMIECSKSTLFAHTHDLMDAARTERLLANISEIIERARLDGVFANPRQNNPPSGGAGVPNRDSAGPGGESRDRIIVTGSVGELQVVTRDDHVPSERGSDRNIPPLFRPAEIAPQDMNSAGVDREAALPSYSRRHRVCGSLVSFLTRIAGKRRDSLDEAATSQKALGKRKITGDEDDKPNTGHFSGAGRSSRDGTEKMARVG